MSISPALKTNYAAFKAIEPALLEKNSGKFAVMYQGKLQEILDTIGDAVKYGEKLFQRGNFSVQPIGARPVSLGFYSCF
ncbi:MAG: hypothetical protein ACK5XX_06570 [Holosporales bacterium]